MKIAFNSIQIPQTSFGAKFYNAKGEESLVLDHYSGTDQNIALGYGHNETRIQSKKFLSYSKPDGTYENFVKINIKNPIFDNKTFYESLPATTSKLVGNTKLQKSIMIDFIKAGGIEKAEDKAIRAHILDNIDKIFKNKRSTQSLNPIIILKNIVANANKIPNYMNFPSHRISDFYTVATQLLEEIIQNGYKSIRK